MNGTVIVGAGHAGGTLAAQLRQMGYSRPITLIGSEPIAPYQRPPLSKKYLLDAIGSNALLLKPETYYASKQISLRLGVGVVRIDREARNVDLSDGESLSFETLVLATGARARGLPIFTPDCTNVFTLRTIADAIKLREVLVPGARLGIVGGGYVGLEVAASARARGMHVTVIEREPRLLARVASDAMSSFVANYHAERGVELVLGRSVVGVRQVRGRVSELLLDDGACFACDAVVVGIGAIPNDEIALEAKIVCKNGILVDENCRTSDPSILAVGDVTCRPVMSRQGTFRIESVPSALEQSRRAACAVVGRPAPAPEVPWFWSDQFDLKVQIAGLLGDSDEQVVRGDRATGSLCVSHLRNGRITAIECVNSPAEFMAGKRAIAQGAAAVSPDDLCAQVSSALIA